jgi:exopolysaccharide production protein ExoY
MRSAFSQDTFEETSSFTATVSHAANLHPSLFLVGRESVRTGLLNNRVGNTCKRAVDIVGSLALLTLSLPLMLLVALATRLDSPGPVLFSQRRMGQHGNTFLVWKFRTMVIDAQERLESYLQANPELRAEWEAIQKLKNDPRVTPLGRFLRRTSLDELPQFWNVLMGDMSLIGPRPIVYGEIVRFGPFYRYYRGVRPGITGLWQVSGRSDTSYQQRVALDARYVREWSMRLDAWILWKTVGVVLHPRGAY